MYLVHTPSASPSSAKTTLFFTQPTVSDFKLVTAHAVEGGQAVQPGPGPRAGGSVHTPHQPLRRGRGGIAPAAARRPAASPAPTGQERSPRPPSGCRGQFSGDSARPSAADLSQLAFAAQLSNIHLWDFSPAAPFHEPGRGRGIPSGGLSSLSEKRAGERQREQCVTGPPTGTLCSGKELCLLLSLCKPLRALQSNPTPAPQNFSSSPPPPPPLQDTPPVISYVNHTGCVKTWNRIFPTVVSSFVCVYQLGNVALYTRVINIL
ncbi:atherin-like [Ursus maritimus]|uniref:Atherin-like n=1 Tax=Ursus maritimus TaxID=29073 RepID=A0A8M1FKG9_URSMA|nr:atherin-like [Ursus maritimus]